MHSRTVSTMQKRLHIVIPFADDSTLIFATQMRRALRNAAPTATIELALIEKENALSHRQMTALLPEGPKLRLGSKELSKLVWSQAVDAVVTSRMFQPLGAILREHANRPPIDRAAIISFLGGLEFFPTEAWKRRRNSDGVFLFPKSACTRFREIPNRPSHQKIGFGHPVFLRPKRPVPDRLPEGDICFFTQAISPLTYASRQHMLKVMIAIATANPERRVRLKLRHMPDENRRHKHKERFDYPSLMTSFQDLPDNLDVTACTMEEAIETAALGITCTSTAAIDLVREGVPTMVYLDYVGNYNDPLVPAMRALFDASGVITPIEDVLNLRYKTPHQGWLDEFFCRPEIGQEVVDMINDLRIQP